MKNLITILSLVLIANSICHAQLPGDYPFKTVLASDGNLFVTGDSLNPSNNMHYFVVKKFFNGLRLWSKDIENPDGEAKGLDVTIDSDGKPIATGYKFNSSTNSIDLVVVKLDKNSGNILWNKTFTTPYNDKGLGVKTDDLDNVYVTGYTTNKFNKTDIITLKYNFDGAFQWSKIYDNRAYKGNDIGTAILLDSSYVYVMGSTENGYTLSKDIILLNYNLNGDSLEANIHELTKTNEIPTSFVISELASKKDKSRISLTSVTDNSSPNSPSSKYLTIDFLGGRNLRFHWAKTFTRDARKQSVATSIDSDENGNVYVTGYSNSDFTGFDFATIKYTEQGNFGWTNDSVLFYDAGSGSDKASSIKVFGDSVYVSGSSQYYPGGYRTIAYKQNNNQIHFIWDNVFVPTFANELIDVNKASILNIDKATGNITILVMEWDDLHPPKYAIRGYAGNGTTLYTFDDGDASGRISEKGDPNSLKGSFSYELSQNYPNPFNPVTVIRYSLIENRFVKLKVYDVLGNEVVTLVNGRQDAGYHTAEFNGSYLSSGMYYYKLIADGVTIGIKRMTLLK